MVISKAGLRLSFCATALLILSACGEGDMVDSNMSVADINDVSTQDWEQLAGKTIYFGHQSVGFNIVEGMERVIQTHPAIKLTIEEAPNVEDVHGPVFAHSAIGQNRDPRSKMRDFRNKMENGLGDKADIALFKFCYVDFSGDTDVDAMFQQYVRTIEDLEEEYPQVTFVHSTVPLEIASSPIKNTIKKLLGKPLYAQAANINRNRFNRMMLSRYADQGKVFDLAGYESTTGDGSRISFKEDGEVYYSLNPEYSLDGSHLNEKGEVAVGTAFLVFLQSISER